MSAYRSDRRCFSNICIVHFLLRKRKRTKRNRPCPATLRVSLRFSKWARAVKLASLRQSQRFFRPFLRCSARNKWETVTDRSEIMVFRAIQTEHISDNRFHEKASQGVRFTDIEFLNKPDRHASIRTLIGADHCPGAC